MVQVGALEELGRLLADVRAYARRGRKEVTAMLVRLSRAAEQVRVSDSEHSFIRSLVSPKSNIPLFLGSCVRHMATQHAFSSLALTNRSPVCTTCVSFHPLQVLGSIVRHMAREETEVFPLLERHLCVSQQRAMVWRTLSAMPLRLLERVLPWVTASLSGADVAELLRNIRLGAPKPDLEPDSVLVQLMERWAERGHSAAAAAAGDGAGGGGVRSGAQAWAAARAEVRGCSPSSEVRNGGSVMIAGSASELLNASTGTNAGYGTTTNITPALTTTGGDGGAPGAAAFLGNMSSGELESAGGNSSAAECLGRSRDKRLQETLAGGLQGTQPRKQALHSCEDLGATPKRPRRDVTPQAGLGRLPAANERVRLDARGRRAARRSHYYQPAV